MAQQTWLDEFAHRANGLYGDDAGIQYRRQFGTTIARLRLKAALRRLLEEDQELSMETWLKNRPTSHLRTPRRPTHEEFRVEAYCSPLN